MSDRRATTSRRTVVRIVTVAAVAASATLLTGCPAGEDPAPAATKRIDGALRTDPAPVLRRLPGLPTPQAVTWASGVFGDLRNPGPSTYWIDAIVTLREADAARLRALATQPKQPPADLAEPIAPLVPAGALRGSDELDAALAPATGWGAQAYLVDRTPTLLVTAVGE